MADRFSLICNDVRLFTINDESYFWDNLVSCNLWYHLHNESIISEMEEWWDKATLRNILVLLIKHLGNPSSALELFDRCVSLKHYDEYWKYYSKKCYEFNFSYMSPIAVAKEGHNLKVEDGTHRALIYAAKLMLDGETFQPFPVFLIFDVGK